MWVVECTIYPQTMGPVSLDAPKIVDGAGP